MISDFPLLFQLKKIPCISNYFTKNYHFVVKQDKTTAEQTTEAISVNIQQQPQSRPTFEGKPNKQQAKVETEKLVKNKENNVSKTKSKKSKEEKKEETELKFREEDDRAEVKFNGVLTTAVTDVVYIYIIRENV